MSSRFESTGCNAYVSSEVLSSIETSSQTIEDVGSRYFAGIHPWIPFLCPKDFQEGLCQFKLSPKADFSILLLCMALLTGNPLQPCTTSVRHAELYLRAKTLLTQFRVLQHPSLVLVQAGIFIAIYEYFQWRPDDALASIDACVRMACKAGFHLQIGDHETSPAWNTWWALVMFERIFYSEATVVGLPLITSLPKEADTLPRQHGDRGCPSTMQSTTYQFSSAFLEIDCLHRAAQATCLLDKVFEADRSTATIADAMSLLSLDIQLQHLLSTTMEHCHRQREGHCGAVSISIRYE